MPRIDAHQHYWRYRPQHYPWIDERMSVLRQDFDPPRLRPLLQEQGFDGALAVQARPSEDETLALLALAEQCEGVCGVVGWLDIAAPQLAQRLEALRPYGALRGCAIRCRTKRIRRPGWRGRRWNAACKRCSAPGMCTRSW